MNKPKLTVVCLAYNQKKYIADAIDSFLMQKVNCTYEVLVSDDCSTDGTAEIIKEYADKYPDIIKPIFRKENLGINKNFIDTLSKVNSEYALCNEGDDYFTDPLKLQKQIDFLEAHPDFSICFHPVNVIFDDGSKPDYIFPDSKMRHHKNIFELEDLLKGNFIQTNSCMYRWGFNGEKFEDIFPNNILPCDWFLHLLHAEKGKIKFLPEVMAVYRRNIGGIWVGAGISDEHYINNAIAQMNCYRKIESYFNYDCATSIQEMGKKLAISALRTRNYNKLKEFQEAYQDVYESVVQSFIPNKEIIKLKKYKKLYRIFLNSILILLLTVILLIVYG